MKRFWIQTVALFHDAYRQLNSKRMFWICLAISGLVVLTFLAIGVSDNGQLSLFGVVLPLPLQFSKAEIYTIAFNSLGVGIWFSLVGTILALISTASIFPDWVTGGSIDLYLSKPIGRLQLFLTKYLTGLLFVTLQVLVFCAASFLVIGIRGKLWEPGIFLAVPLVVCFFSYLFSFCVLIGLLTRSTTAAFLLTLLFWFMLWGLDRADIICVIGEHASQHELAGMDNRIKQQHGSLQARKDMLAATQPTDAQNLDLKEREKNLQRLLDEQTQDQQSLTHIQFAHEVILRVKTFLPKTRETTELLNRCLMNPDELAELDAHRAPGQSMPRLRPPRPRFDEQSRKWTDPAVLEEASAEMESRPVSWIIGWSLAFEAGVLVLASWIFCRRDY